MGQGYEPFEVVKQDGRTILRLHGTEKQRVKVEADKVRIIMDSIAGDWDIDISYADIEGDLDIRTMAGNLKRSGHVKLVKGNIGMSSCNISGAAYFGYAKFSGRADFGGAKFGGKANFEFAEFSEYGLFGAAKFDREANFAYAKFSRYAIFHSAKFRESVCFEYAEFSGDAYFGGDAKFTGDAYFGYAKFSGKADFGNAEFGGEANFGGSMFTGVTNFSSSTFKGVASFNDSTFTEEVAYFGTSFERKADFSVARFSKGLYLNSAKFEKCGSSLLLRNSAYSEIYVDLPDEPNDVPRFLNDPSEDTYFRLLRNQRDLGRPYKSLYVAMKRDQRKRKSRLVRWLELLLFDLPTRYGTASFPPRRIVIYIVLVLVVFTASYYGINADLQCSRGVGILEYHNTDGGELKSQRKPGITDICWFSLNTFVPGAKFVNVQHWRIRDDVVLKFIRCSTLATVESILGWLLVPVLLRYFRL